MEINSQFDQEKMNEHFLDHQKNRKLDAAELGNLFGNYLGDTMFHCIFTYFLKVVEDEEIKELTEYTYNVTSNHIKIMQDIYNKEGIPVPVGFGDLDIFDDSPRLFSDVFILLFITESSKEALLKYSGVLSTSTRYDMVNYAKMCLNESIEVYEKGKQLLMSKGQSMNPPEIPYPQNNDIVKSKSFVSFLSGNNRPLTGLEIQQLQININTNVLGKTLMLGYSQVASSDNLRKYFRDGAKVADRQIKKLAEYFTNENLPSPSLMDAHITDSSIAPFSDKLMLYHTTLANSIGISNYGIALSEIMRHDLHGSFMSLSVEIGKFANEGMNLMIANGWLEEPPTAADREGISKHPSGKKTIH